VGLATVREPTLVVETIAKTLGAQDELVEHLGEREVLLLLDNLEQVIESAAALADLVESCPNLVLLVTSRELLGVRARSSMRCCRLRSETRSNSSAPERTSNRPPQ
jgi:non-specific serine/threonine protein kinase